MTTIEQQIDLIVETVIDRDWTSIGFDDGIDIFWNDGMSEWMAIFIDDAGLRRASFWDNNLGRLIGQYVSDDSVKSWIEQYCDEEAAE